ncbi:MAG TPA: AtpZ/AtpI family protein [Candidatus Hydrogenedens sp.]|nr:AtpZ/AtpI family protein [Candidatus Hydrogenedens sp.]
MKINKDFTSVLSTISNLGFSLSILILLGFFIGSKLDEYFQTDGILLAISILLSILIGFVGFFTTIFKKLK